MSANVLFDYKLGDDNLVESCDTVSGQERTAGNKAPSHSPFGLSLVSFKMKINWSYMSLLAILCLAKSDPQNYFLGCKI
jgi:hypothetical protein